jgi:C-terminal processing protease CtpA/Prc
MFPKCWRDTESQNLSHSIKPWWQSCLDSSADAKFANAVGIAEFLETTSGFTIEDRMTVVRRALQLLENYYAHLPLKKAMYAVDPIQRLRLLRRKLADFSNDLEFHVEMVEIFASLRDLHTRYVLPKPFSDCVAVLPFRIEEYYINGQRKFLVAAVVPGFRHATFQAGVTVSHWNGMAIQRAIEVISVRQSGGNLDARRIRGIAALTTRALAVTVPPDEEWVDVRYLSANGSAMETRFHWAVIGLPVKQEPSLATLQGRDLLLGLDIETHTIGRVNTHLYASAQDDSNENSSERTSAKTEDRIPTSLGNAILARKVNSRSGSFGYIRIFTFNVDDAAAFVQEIARLLEFMPSDGLIIDVRDNGGGLLAAGEGILQLFTPNKIETARFQFINSSPTLSLCEKAAEQDSEIRAWTDSIRRSLETGATFSAAIQITPGKAANSIGQRYFGPVVVITNARSYSTTDLFAAGFQDNDIGIVFGVDGSTGAGGANVWTYETLRSRIRNAGPVEAELEALPKGADLSVAIRRSLRVGPHAGTELEDFGVTPDCRYFMSYDDVINKNVNLIEHACEILASQYSVVFDITVRKSEGAAVSVIVRSKNIDALIAILHNDERKVRRVCDAGRVSTSRFQLARAPVEVCGFRGGHLVARRKL